MKRISIAAQLGAVALMAGGASAQEAAPTPPPAASTEQALPEIEVIQETPAQKARAKKKTAPVAPIAAKPSAPAAPPAGAPQTETTQTPSASASGDGSGELTEAKIPSAVSSVTSYDIQRDGTGQIQQVLQREVPGIILSDASGNPLRAEVSYRGFDASPVSGRPQGLAVYQDGVRINEAFGDTVNWEVLPSNAIESMSVVSNNPTFGLNALGGAVSIIMKDGFSYQGAEIDMMGGSFGRAQIGVQAGMQSGNAAAYIATEGVREDGFRDFSDSELKRVYGDLGLRGSNSEWHFSITGADNSTGVTAAAPEELLDESWSRTFSNPQVTDIEVLMPTLSGTVKATETLTFSGVAYYRRLKSNVIDGNLTDVAPCNALDPAGDLCLEGGTGDTAIDINGNDITGADVLDFNDPLGSIERINTLANSFGGTLQAVEKARVFGRPNQLLVGISYDHGKVKYNTSSELGRFGDKFTVTGGGVILGGDPAEEDTLDVAPRNLETQNDYYGMYFSNTFDVTDQFALTVGGRYNHATIKMEDLTGLFDDLNTTNKYQRFNPMVGGTYRFMPALSVYGSYSEANRAPTAAELGCAEPDNPCLIESFLTDDPPLKQVVSRSVELGLRGEIKSYDSQRVNWSLGYFRAVNSDDLLNVTSPDEPGRGYFLNAGDTKREGLEAAVRYENTRMTAYASYALVNATFLDDLELPAPNTPEGTVNCTGASGPDPAQCNLVQSGDYLPGIPRHRFKVGVEYWMTPKWRVGADLVAASNQFFFGDEANNNAKLPGYVRLDLNSSYDITDKIQVYGLIKNAFNSHYGLYGTYFDTEEGSDASTEGFTFDNPRSITPALPFAAYGGVKVKF